MDDSLRPAALEVHRLPAASNIAVTPAKVLIATAAAMVRRFLNLTTLAVVDAGRQRSR